jgi:hypothetical protein
MLEVRAIYGKRLLRFPVVPKQTEILCQSLPALPGCLKSACRRLHLVSHQDAKPSGNPKITAIFLIYGIDKIAVAIRNRQLCQL